MGLILIVIVAAIPFAIGIKIFLWSVDYLVAPIADSLERLINKAIGTNDLNGTITITYLASEKNNDKTCADTGAGRN